MTSEQIATLGHAFFDGKVLQLRYDGKWEDWTRCYCPNFDTDCKWRIKPDKQKKSIAKCFIDPDGWMYWKTGRNPPANWKRLPELDREITLPEGE